MSTVTPPGGSSPGSYKVQCSGWFPDWLWLADLVPAGNQRSFQLSQGYPLGIPVLDESPPGRLRIARYDPYPPATSRKEAPWLAFRFDTASERLQYLDALKTYLLEGNIGAADVEDDFVVQNNSKRSWYHVPMMTTKPHARREPHHGLTKERGLRSNQHNWISNADRDGLRTFAIGAYNWLGGYTIGKVFADPNPQLATPAAAKFIAGSFVFKLLFAEHASIEGDDPLVGAPEWHIQDVDTPAGGQLAVRLVQVDVAVRDPRASKTGWVFATFVYDKSMTAMSPWAKLRPVGLQWGNDAGVTDPASIVESWINPAVPAVYNREDGLLFGRSGRLNGPVDNPVSSCLSCHSTAQIVTGETNAARARGVTLVPPDGPPPAGSPDCTLDQELFWFHDVAVGAAFGVMDRGGTGCALASPQPASPPLHGLDYSLQLADALESSLAFRNENPCASLAETLRDADVIDTPTGDARATAELRESISASRLREFGTERVRALPRGLVRTQTKAALRDAKPPMKTDAITEDPHQR